MQLSSAIQLFSCFKRLLFQQQQTNNTLPPVFWVTYVF